MLRCGLAAKLVAANLLGAQELPEALFSVRRLIAEIACEVALLGVAVHGSLFTPSPTLPTSGREPNHEKKAAQSKGAGSNPSTWLLSRRWTCRDRPLHRRVEL